MTGCASRSSSSRSPSPRPTPARSSGHAATNLVLEQIGYGLLGGIPAGILGALALRFSARRELIGAATGCRSSTWPRRCCPRASRARSVAASSSPRSPAASCSAHCARTPAARSASSSTRAASSSTPRPSSCSARVVLGPVLDELTWQVVVYAVLSLTVVRMLPVALALIGTGARRRRSAFLGWFGPRGLASIVFAVILIDDADLPHLRTPGARDRRDDRPLGLRPRPYGQPAHRALRALVGVAPTRRAAARWRASLPASTAPYRARASRSGGRTQSALGTNGSPQQTEPTKHLAQITEQWPNRHAPAAHKQSVRSLTHAQLA